MSKSPDAIPDTFWSVVEQAQRDHEKLRALLMPMSRPDLLAFYAYFRDAALALTAPRYLKHMGSHASEDEADDLGRWVVTQGKAYCRDVLDHPEKMPIDADPDHSPEARMFGQIGKVYYAKFGEDLPTDVEL